MSKSIIATVSYDRNDSSLRDRMIQSFQEWKALGMDVVTSDSGSSEEFVKKIKDMGIEVLRRPDGFVGTGIKQSIQKAVELGADKIVYTESDKSRKYGFTKEIKTCLSKLEEADIVIPSRTALAFATYPHVRQWTETNIINFFYGKLLYDLAGSEVKDYSYGPRVFRKEVAPFFVKSPYIDWAASFEPLINMAHDGAKKGKKRKITEVKVDAEYPVGTDALDAQATAYRVEQSHQIMQPIIAYYRTHKPDKFFDIFRQYSSILQRASNLMGPSNF